MLWDDKLNRFVVYGKDVKETPRNVVRTFEINDDLRVLYETDDPVYFAVYKTRAGKVILGEPVFGQTIQQHFGDILANKSFVKHLQWLARVS